AARWLPGRGEHRRPQVLLHQQRYKPRLAIAEAESLTDGRSLYGALLRVAQETDAAVRLPALGLRLGDVVQEGGQLEQDQARGAAGAVMQVRVPLETRHDVAKVWPQPRAAGGRGRLVQHLVQGGE